MQYKFTDSFKFMFIFLAQPARERERERELLLFGCVCVLTLWDHGLVGLTYKEKGLLLTPALMSLIFAIKKEIAHVIEI